MKKQFQTVAAVAFIAAAISVPTTVTFLKNSASESSTNIAAVSENSSSDIQNQAAEIEAEIKAEEFDSAMDEEKISKLELHKNTLTVCSMDEANQMIQDGEDSYEKSGALRRIDNLNYARKVINESAKTMSADSIDLTESKSYIYHMMLNSVDYFNTAKGSMIYSFGGSEQIKTEFITNIDEQYACEKEYYYDGSVGERHVYDGKEYTINETLGINDVCYCSEPSGSNISDNNRVVMLDEGELLRINRKDLTNLAVSGNSCLFPQQYAMSSLYDFDNWSITGCEDFIGRKCAVIEGANDGGSFKMLVDVNYGFLLKYEKYSFDGKLISYTEVTELENDIVLSKEMAEIKN